MSKKYQIEISTVITRKQKVLWNILLRLDRNCAEELDMALLPQKPLRISLCALILVRKC